MECELFATLIICSEIARALHPESITQGIEDNKHWKNILLNYGHQILVKSLARALEVKFHKDFIRVEKDTIFIGLTSKPEKGKANLELIKKLATYFRVSSSQIRIISGLRSKTKIVEKDDD